MGYPARPSAPVPAQLTHRLAELILAESARAGLGPGSRLPTERQLAADLGATRTSIRHALAMLEAEGHISREVGRGTFLRQSPGQSPGQQAPGAGSALPAPLRPGGGLAGPDDGAAGPRYADQAGALRLARDPGRPARLAGTGPAGRG
ncbi:MAG: winged helix-turn-helix domain-containing protein, partial [Streptosporangiales bacterium]